jgi:hypothetical protein
MTPDTLNDMFTDATLKKLFPLKNADRFFDALYGDVTEGAYDIALTFDSLKNDILKFHFNLRRRPNKCLACNLTYGLPHVFSRHPVINAQGLVDEIEKLLDGKALIKNWDLGDTKEISGDLHIIPLLIQVQPA